MRKLLVIILILVAIGLSYFYWMNSKSNKAIPIQKISSAKKEILSKLHYDWNHGVNLKDEHLQKNCPWLENIKSIPDELRGCHREIFRCFYENRKGKVKVGKVYEPYKIYFKSPKDKGPDRWQFSLEIGLNGQKQQIFLKNSCHKVMLPKYFYNHGRIISKQNTWHPGDTSYWIDKYKVRNIDVWDWVQDTSRKDITIDLSQAFDETTTLKKKQMEAYCRYRGGVVMSSRVADAVTYYSTESMVSGLLSKRLSPYPFTPRKSEFVHKKALKNNNYKMTKKDCLTIETKECLELGQKQDVAETLGWAGVGELLGGSLEYVHNTVFDRYNLILSSYYFDLKSAIHRAGERGHWDGDGHGLGNVKFYMANTIQDNKLKIAFRCMGVKN